MIRHAPSLPVALLSVPMIVSALPTLLMPAIGGAPLPKPGYLAAGEAAIALSAITVGAQEEQSPTVRDEARSLSKNHFASGRHACSQAALDTGGNFVAG
jgi:hypothetical protein